MAETTKSTEKKEEREDITIPRAQANEDPNLIVGINGKIWVLPKGKTSNVPSFVADEIRRSWRAEDAFAKKTDELIERSK